MSNIQVSHHPETEEQIRQYPESILEHGYGMVGKYVMQDRALNVIAKAIYSYVCTFGNGAFPGRDKICYDLQINKSTYAKYIKQLVDYGYITIVQTRGEHQTFCRNVYEVNLNPQRVLELRAQEAKKAAASQADTVDDLTVYGETIHGETLEKSPCPISPYTVKPDTNNTSVNTTNGVVVLNHYDNKTTTSTTTSNSSKAEEEGVAIHSREEEPSERDAIRQKILDVIREEMGAAPEESIVSFPGRQNSSARLFDGEHSVAEDEVITVLGEFGIAENTARGFLREYGYMTIWDKCRYLRRLVVEGKVKNPGGWLRRALEQDYVDGKGVAEELAAKEKRRRQEAIAAQKARIEAMIATEKGAYEPVTVPGCEGLHGTDLVQAWKQRVKGTGT